MKNTNVRDFTTPFNELLGIKVTAAHKDGVTVVCQFREDLRNAWGTLHGGVTATLIDVAAGVATMHVTGKRATTVSLKLSYFLPLTEGKVTARAKVLRAGSSLTVASVEVKDAKKRLAAFGMVTYKILG
jgi:uncharacterized protein (TIGR00369 family)